MLERIGRYELKEKVGAGGQAIVYLAWDTTLEREVAVKVMNQVATTQEEYIDTLRNEAILAAGLSHPNIATVHDFTVEGEHACIVMEFFPNSLDKEIANNGPMSPARAVEVISKICEALSYAHSMGFVHRDIKPHNVLMGADGSPKVTDFGISRASDLSVATSSAGTPLYMSPEQCKGEESIDIRSDIYAIGITFYEILTGTPPFQGSVPQLYRMHIEEPLPSIDQSFGIPSNIEDVIKKCMEKDPDKRYQNVSEIISALGVETNSRPTRGGAPMASEGGSEIQRDDPIPTGKDWRRQGRYTVLGLIGKNDRSGLSWKVQAGADEVVIVRKNGEIQDVFSEERKGIKSFAESIGSLFRMGPKYEVYKATKTRFNIVFWLGDDTTLATGNKSFTFGLPVLTSDNQVIPAKINLWLEVNDDLPENLLLLLRGQDSLNRFDIASEIREDLLAKVLGLDLSQYSFDELRGNRDLLKEIGNSIEREISGTLATYGLNVQDYSISWGLTLQERADIDQQRHQVALEEVRNINEIDRLRSEGKETESRKPLDVVLRPSKWAKIVGAMSLTAAIIFMLVNGFNLFRSEPAPPAPVNVSVAVPTAAPIPVVPTAIPIEQTKKQTKTNDEGKQEVFFEKQNEDIFHMSKLIINDLPGLSGNFPVEVEVTAVDPLQAPPPPKGVTVLRMMDVSIFSEGSSTDYIETADSKLEFALEKAWLEDQSVDMDDVAMYRYSKGEWGELSTTHLGTVIVGETALERFAALTPGFSIFSVGVKTYSRSELSDDSEPYAVATSIVPNLNAPQLGLTLQPSPTGPSNTLISERAATSTPITTLGLNTERSSLSVAPTSTPIPTPTPTQFPTITPTQFPTPTPTPTIKASIIHAKM